MEWKIVNSTGRHRVIVTKNLPGHRWLEMLEGADCRVEICQSEAVLDVDALRAAVGSACDGAIGQLTEDWGEPLLTAFKAAGGSVYSNYAVGFDNVDVAAATRLGIPVGNTPGVLTETTAEMTVALTFAAARRLGEAERFLRAGKFSGWLPTLFLGQRLWRKTVGIIGAGRIGQAYARMMVEGFKMDLLYYDPHPKPGLEASMRDYGRFLESQGTAAVKCRRTQRLEDLLREADCVSIHTVLDPSTRHLIHAGRLAMMKKDALLINTSRGPVIDEAALVAHCRRHPDFRAALDVFENEPALEPGLTELDNVVIVPHIASATGWTREGMAVLAAANVAAVFRGDPVWPESDVTPFLGNAPPKAAPSIVNARDLDLF